MGLKSKKQRRNGVEMRRMNLLVPVDTFEKIELLAGPRAHNYVIEKMTEREWKRRMKKIESAHIQKKAC